MNDMIEIVCATRLPARDFWETTALGRSLHRETCEMQAAPRIVFENRIALSKIYSAHLAGAGIGDLVIFVHDDVYLSDYSLADHVIGVAGNRRRQPGQAGWGHIDAKWKCWDEVANLSGRIAHGCHGNERLNIFGPCGPCELLDGAFLATRRSVLQAARLKFDDLTMHQCRFSNLAGQEDALQVRLKLQRSVS